MAQHTPGPWFVTDLMPTTLGYDGVSSENMRDIATCHYAVAKGPHGFCQSVDTDVIRANAHLIAAAPDLLAALNTLVDAICDCGLHSSDFPGAAMEVARAAIDKAEPAQTYESDGGYE